MKNNSLLLILVMQILLILPSFAQELFIRDVIAKSSEMISPNAKSGDIQNDYQQEQQIIDNYLKQINPNFSADNLIVHIGLTQKKHFLFDVLYKGILVDKHKITLHQYTDTTMLITGTTLFSNDIDIHPILTLQQAIENLKLTNNLITDESILSNNLVIYKALGGVPYLCYKMKVLLSSTDYYQYYVSASNGEILNINPLTRRATPEIGTASLKNWGTQNIFTSKSSNKYILYDQGAKIKTYNATNMENIFNSELTASNALKIIIARPLSLIFISVRPPT